MKNSFQRHLLNVLDFFCDPDVFVPIICLVIAAILAIFVLPTMDKSPANSAKYQVSVITGRFHTDYKTSDYRIEDGVITFTSVPDGKVIIASSFYIVESGETHEE